MPEADFEQLLCVDFEFVPTQRDTVGEKKRKRGKKKKKRDTVGNPAKARSCATGGAAGCPAAKRSGCASVCETGPLVAWTRKNHAKRNLFSASVRTSRVDSTYYRLGSNY